METNISASQQISQANSAGPQASLSSKPDLNMDDFFKLLTVQLTSQDPLKPMEDTEFIAQMTSFSSLSEMENIAADMKGLREVQSSYNVQLLLGKEVTATDVNGEEIKGTVTRITNEDGKMVPYLGNERVEMINIKEISN